MFAKPQRFANRISVAMWMIAAMTVTAAAEDGKAGRYTMSPSADGFVRLDTQTGEMSLCSKVADDWACRPMANANKAASGDSSEIAALRQENEELRAEIKKLDEMLGLGDKDGKSPVPHRPGGSNFQLPTEKQVDEALDYFTNMIKKFQEKLKELDKSPPQPEPRAL